MIEILSLKLYQIGPFEYQPWWDCRINKRNIVPDEPTSVCNDVPQLIW